MSTLEFRVIPKSEPLAGDLSARRIFESYGADLQSMKVQTGIGAVTGALAGGKMGVPGVVIGSALGALAGYWKGKTYRNKIYAQLDAAGVLEGPRIARRSVLNLRNAQFVFLRYPYAELTALVIVPLLQKYYPYMTVSDLTVIGQNAQRTLLHFRRENPDAPIALAADVILAYYGIMKNAAGVYDLVAPPTAGQHYVPPPPGHIPTLPKPPGDTDGREEADEPNYWLYAAIVAGAVILATR